MEKFKLLNCWDAKEIPPDTSQEERLRLLERQSIVSAEPFTDPICTQQTEMPLHEELIVMVCWLLFFAIPLWGPFILLYIICSNLKAGVAFITACVVISKIPCPQNTKLCYHYLASLNLKYFSFRAIWLNTTPKGTYIGVTPPHGLFPIAGLLGLCALPRFGLSLIIRCVECKGIQCAGLAGG